MTVPIRVRKAADGVHVHTEGYDAAVVEHLRAIPGRRWDTASKVWVVPRTEEALNAVLRAPSASFDVDPTLIHLARVPYESVHTPDPSVELLQRVSEELRLQGYSPRTRKNYVGHLRRFFRSHPEAARDLTAVAVRHHLLQLQGDGLSVSYRHQAISAIQFLARMLGQPMVLEPLRRPKRERQLPNVLSRGDVRRIIAAAGHPRHRLALILVYSGGLRVSEVVRLRIGDLDLDRRMIRVRASKGRKDRYTLLADAAIEALGPHVAAGSPKDWLFSGQRPGRHLSVRSVQKIFERALKRSGVRHHATVHTLRHSFATHLLESGVSVRHIQTLLGHTSPKTTEIYTHVSTSDLGRIRNPLDAMLDQEE